MENFNYIMMALLAVSLIINIIILITGLKKDKYRDEFRQLKKDIEDISDRQNKDTLDFIDRQTRQSRENREAMMKADAASFRQFSTTMRDSLSNLNKTVIDMTGVTDKRNAMFQDRVNKQIDGIRRTMEKSMSDMQTSNEKKLEEMRRTVDEKLQKTLDERINQSFKMVSDRLDRVYKSLGEMQKVGRGVDDLKRVLSNVKTRGILGEVRLGGILEDILSPEQYETNVATKRNSRDRVEFAVKLPGNDGEFVYLPIDAKFPLDAYQNLLDAYDSADPARTEEAVKTLKSRIRGFAKDISSKYIDVPATTEFAIMFLPTEGLYAEVVRYGMVEELQKEKINIAGPTTMAALLNSLQMGFRTLAIQKRSGQVWKVLEEVKSEFTKFGDVLEKAQNNMRRASDDLDKLIGTRTNAINRKLRDVSEFSPEDDKIALGE